MSLQEFWTRVRIGAGLLSPQVSVDSRHLDPERLRDQLASAAIWLTPRTVEGFARQDFDFLPSDKAEQLAQNVDAFLSVARAVAPDAPAAAAQISSALPPFLKILTILEPDKHADADAFVIAKTIQSDLALPHWVRDLRFQTGVDVADAPALWVWVIADDEAAEAPTFRQETHRVREQIASALRRHRIPHWPYVRFRRQSEQEEFQEALRA